MPRHNSNSETRSVAVSQHYQGALPPPAMLEQFDRLYPGTAKMLIDNVVAESNQRRRLLDEESSRTTKQVDADIKMGSEISMANTITVVATVISMLSCLGFAAYFFIQGNVVAGGAFLTTPVVVSILNRIGLVGVKNSK